MTDREASILKFIRDTVNTKGYPPTVREICNAVGLKSTSTVHGYLKNLKEKGLISNVPDTPRTIKIEKDEIEDPIPSAKNKNPYTFYIKDSSVETLKIYCEKNNVDIDIAIERAIQLLGLIEK